MLIKCHPFYIKNCTINVDLKIISKTLSEKLKKVLPDLTFSQQTAYVKNRHIEDKSLKLKI